MKILIEGYSYSPEVVKNVLPEKRLLLTDEKVTIENVGYFRNPECDDFVFFLPKVLLEQIEIDGAKRDRVFAVKGDPAMANGFAPEEIIDPEAETPDGRKLTDEQKSFLYEFAVWIYRAIAQFKERNKATTAVWEQKERQSGAFKRKYVTNTLLDVILALRRFHRDNRDYFLFKVKEKHSGANKINWTRTIAKSQAIIQKGRPLYLDPRSKKRAIDFDEELLVIFYSILSYIRARFGFPVQINMGYELITGEKFERYLAGYGATRLKAIKYKYFSDRDLTLWQLCFAFFDKAHKANVVSDDEEYLLAKNFEIVFESMIDDLVGDEEIAELRDLSDGKEIDHLYLDESLTRRSQGGEKTFYIADSKYYKRGNSLGAESVAKQFTYARNLLQLDLDLFLNGDDASDDIKRRRRALDKVDLMRDKTTEGYDVIPNFFISATVPEDLRYDDDNLVLHEGAREYRNIHFENRLFDRDTLILSHYDVNFLYVVKLYAQNDAGLKDEWRNKVHSEFRAHIRGLLKDRFSFYAMMPYDELSDEDATLFLRENFRSALGKVYSPYPKVNGKTVYSLALENPDKMFKDNTLSDEGFEKRKARVAAENDAVKNLLKTAFYIIPCELGENPSTALQEEAESHPIPGAKTADVSESVVVATGYAKGYIDAVRSNGRCPWDASSCKTPLAVQMFVFPHTNQADVFSVNGDAGVQGPMPPEKVKADFPEFASIELSFASYYVWSVNLPKDATLHEQES